MINLISYFSHEKIQERKSKKEIDQKNVDAFWEKFDKLSLEDKEWVIHNYLDKNVDVEIITAKEAEAFEKKDKEMEHLLANWLRLKTLWKKSKTRIEQEKMKLKKQKELQWALLPDTEFEESNQDQESEETFWSGVDSEPEEKK
jgi:hypothetical protein